MKSNQVIFGNLSNSRKTSSSLVELGLQLTKYGRFPKEDVYNGDVLFIGVVVHVVLMSLIGSEIYLTNAPWWATIRALCHPWSWGNFVSSDRSSCQGSRVSSVPRKSRGRLAATLPERSSLCCRTDSGSSSGNHRSWMSIKLVDSHEPCNTNICELD